MFSTYIAVDWVHSLFEYAELVTAITLLRSIEHLLSCGPDFLFRRVLLDPVLSCLSEAFLTTARFIFSKPCEVQPSAPPAHFAFRHRYALWFPLSPSKLGRCEQHSGDASQRSARLRSGHRMNLQHRTGSRNLVCRRLWSPLRFSGRSRSYL